MVTLVAVDAGLPRGLAACLTDAVRRTCVPCRAFVVPEEAPVAALPTFDRDELRGLRIARQDHPFLTHLSSSPVRGRQRTAHNRTDWGSVLVPADHRTGRRIAGIHSLRREAGGRTRSTEP